MANDQPHPKTTSLEEDREDGSPDESGSSDDPIENKRVARRLGTFRGVFRPTVLTILGLMMYVREGWLVGNAGLLGALLIIALTFLISGSAALSLSSITTNIHVGPGGSFSIISQSLGLETGGSIGVPLYLGQALSSALYIYGFTEAWRYIFPDHPTLLVAYAVFALAFGLTFISTQLAFRMQGLVMAVILLSLASIALGLTSLGGDLPLRSPQLWGTFENGGFWVLFAVFFPSGTGIQVGASMSGALRSPRKSIPRGTLAAVGTALLVYVGMAVWYSLVASPEALRGNRLLVIEEAAVGELVLAGILASTFTATLSGLVAAPRVLQALAEHDIVPQSSYFKEVTENEEPRRAMLATGLLVAAAMLLGGLNPVAKLITMFFLLIYLTINAVVAIEQGLGLPAFRPTFEIPRWVPTLGIACCTLALFIISPTFALLALGVVVGLYIYLASRRLQTPWQTVRSSIFVSLADWASKRVARVADEPNERAWKPDLLVPVTSRSQLDGVFRFLRLLAEPKGSLKIIGVRTGSDKERGADTRDDLSTIPNITRSFQDRELMATSSFIEAPSLVSGVGMSSSVLRGSAFRPNILFGLAHRLDEDTLQAFVDIAARDEMGVALLFEHPEAAFGQEQRVNIWASDQSPEWELGLRLPNLDLSVLLGHQIQRQWKGSLRLLTTCREIEEVENARAYLRRLVEDARLPKHTQKWVESGAFTDTLLEAPEADINVLGLAEKVNYELLQEIVRKTRSSCLFVRDSGRESALA